MDDIIDLYQEAKYETMVNDCIRRLNNLHKLCVEYNKSLIFYNTGEIGHYDENKQYDYNKYVFILKPSDDWSIHINTYIYFSEIVDDFYYYM